MSLKLRRNLPLILLLLAFLTFLALGLGDQPIIAYTAAADPGQTQASELLDNDGSTADTLETLGADAGVPQQSTIQGE